MKLRTKSDSPLGINNGYLYELSTLSTGAIISTEIRDSVDAFRDRRLTGYDLPNFHKRKAQGELLPHTPYRKVDITGSSTGDLDISNPTANQRSRNASGNRLRYTDWYFTESEMKAKTDDALSEISQPEVLQQVASKIYNQGWDTLTFLSELHKTIRMFRGAAKRLLGLLSKGRIDKVWLEYRYGWRILYYDLLDIQKVLSNIGEEQRTRYTDFAFQANAWSESDVTTITGSTHDADILIQDSYTVKVTGNISVDVSLPEFQFNPVTTAWELVPYSFIIDWFLNIGQALESMSFITLSQHYESSVTTVVQWERVCTIDSITPKNGNTVLCEQNAVCSGTIIRRIPQRVSSKPYWSVRLDVYKMLDVFYIAAGLLSGGKSPNIRR